MTITYHQGDILASKANVLVNPVNCVGVMGAGLALEFKKRWPEMFEAYVALCNQDKLIPGSVWYLWNLEQPILLFPTKFHWRDSSHIDLIEAGLKAFSNVQWKMIKSIAFPQLGCGLGGLDWKDVQPLMEKYLEPLPIEVEIWEKA